MHTSSILNVKPALINNHHIWKLTMLLASLLQLLSTGLNRGEERCHERLTKICHYQVAWLSIAVFSLLIFDISGCILLEIQCISCSEWDLPSKLSFLFSFCRAEGKRQHQQWSMIFLFKVAEAGCWVIWCREIDLWNLFTTNQWDKHISCHQ